MRFRPFYLVVLPILVLLGLVALIVVVFPSLQHWLAVHTGTVNESGIYYGFWSGFGADLGEVTLVTTVGVGVYTGVRKANCHTKGCWRIGHHALEGTPYHLCAKHHPDVPASGATHAQILEHHRRSLREAQNGPGTVGTTATATPAEPSPATPV